MIYEFKENTVTTTQAFKSEIGSGNLIKTTTYASKELAISNLKREQDRYIQSKAHLEAQLKDIEESLAAISDCLKIG